MNCTSGGVIRSGGVMKNFHSSHQIIGRKSTRILCNALPPNNNNKDIHDRAISILRNTQQIKDWKSYLGILKGMRSDEEHKFAVQQAIQKDADLPLSFGFSAGGCLFPFYIGVAGALQDAGILHDDTKIGGSSAGSLIAACIKSGMTPDEIAEQCLRLMHDCRVNGTRGRLGPVLEDFLKRNLPDDAHERCTGKAYVAVTKAMPYVKPVLLSEFHSRDDLIQALMTSCHIPYWVDGRPFTDFRGQIHLDGGITNFIPIAPNSTGVRVCCFPSKQLTSSMYRIDISPDSFEEWPYSLRQMVQWAFEPADDDMIEYLIEKGKNDAVAWMKSMDLEKEGDKAEYGGERVRAAQERVMDVSGSGGGGGGSVEEKVEVGGEKLKEKATISGN